MLKNRLKPSNLSDSPIDIAKIETTLKRRLAIVLGSKSHGSISRDTGFHPETIRRYRATGRMPATFLIALSQVYSINIDWLVSGEGDQRTHTRKTESVPKVLRDIADQISIGKISFPKPARSSGVELASASIHNHILNGSG